MLKFIFTLKSQKKKTKSNIIVKKKVCNNYVIKMYKTNKIMNAMKKKKDNFLYVYKKLTYFILYKIE